MPRDVHIQRSYNADFDAEAIEAVKQYQIQAGYAPGEAGRRRDHDRSEFQEILNLRAA